VADFCEHGNEPLDSIKGGKFDQISNDQLLKNDFVPCNISYTLRASTSY
jgi:hypothetical protein